MIQKKTVVHITPELSKPAGAIRAVIEGLLSSKCYQQAIGRSIFIGPQLPAPAGDESQLEPHIKLLYSTADRIIDSRYARKLADIERKFGVTIIYGRGTLADRPNTLQNEAEFVLIDVSRANIHPVNAFKGWLYEEFGIESHRYETIPDYEQNVKLAPAALAVLRALDAANPNHPAILIAHDAMGLPTALAGAMDPLGAFKTLFYAHEVATTRRIVEEYPGHDTMFYNALRWAQRRQYYVTEVFGSQDFFYRHALVNAAKHCDHLLAADDHIAQELKFLAYDFEQSPIDLCYAGTTVTLLTPDEKNQRRAKLQQFCEKQLGFRPDTLFAHMAWPVVGKGFWRDLRILEHLDQEFTRRRQSGALILLCPDELPDKTLLPGKKKLLRARPSVLSQPPWDPPIGETPYYLQIEHFNNHSRNIKALMIHPESTALPVSGQTLFDNLDFDDLHKGIDVEFEQSIYPPGGISPMQTLANGGLVVTTNTSGVLNLMRTAGDEMPRQIVVADYTQLDSEYPDLESILAIYQPQRDVIESRVSAQVAQNLMSRLTTAQTEMETRLLQGYEIAQQIDWENICRNHFLPAIERTYRHRRMRHSA